MARAILCIVTEVALVLAILSGGGNCQDSSCLCKNLDPQANKRLIRTYLQEVWGDKNFDALPKYVAEDLIVHNPRVADGLAGFREALGGPLGQGPPIKMDVKQIIAEGDLVWVLLRYPIPAMNTTFAIAGSYEINCLGKIQEHWDVNQDMTLDFEPKNTHPFF